MCIEIHIYGMCEKEWQKILLCEQQDFFINVKRSVKGYCYLKRKVVAQDIVGMFFTVLLDESV